MKKTPLYSRSQRPPPPAAPPASPAAPNAAGTGATAVGAGASAVSAAAGAPTRAQRWRRAASRHERALWAAALAGVLLAAMLWRQGAGPATPLTLEQVDFAMRKSLQEKPLPSQTAAAYETVRGSLVRVVGLMTEGDDGSDRAEAAAAAAASAASTGRRREGDRLALQRGIGSGVVVVDNGTILTNLHVVQGARRIQVTFADGHESEARLVSVQPENDLAVLRALSIPDDLAAATLRSTADLQPGDEVIAAGFPFGIGPSVSAGVVSGLKRQFRSPDGQQPLTNLIQFDAAANPGNSGGPLITNDGAVVGIVTAILNPSQQRVFIGIGFAVPIENAATAVGMHPF